MDLKKRVISNTLITGASNGIIGLLGLILIPIIINNLGIEMFGIYGYLQIFTVIGFMGVFDLGLKQVIIKKTAEYDSNTERDKHNKLVSANIVILSLISIILTTTVVLFAENIANIFSLPEESKSLFSSAIQILAISYFFEFIGMVFQGFIAGSQRYDYLNLVTLSSTLLQTLSIILVVTNGKGLLEITIVIVLVSIMRALLSIVMAKKIAPIKLCRVSLNDIKELLIFTRPLFSAQISSVLSAHGERVLIAIYLNPTLMAYYDVLVKIPRFLKAALSFGGAAVMPAASKLSANNETEKLNKLFRQGFRFNMMLVFPLVAFVGVYSSDIINLWVGDKFESLSILMQFLLLFNVLAVVSSYGWSLMLGTGTKLRYIEAIQWINTTFKYLVWIFLLPVIDLWAVVIASWSLLLTIPVSIKVFAQSFYVKIASILLDIASILVIPVLLFLVVKWFGIQQLDTVLGFILISSVCIVSVWILYYLILMNENERVVVSSSIKNYTLKMKEAIKR